MNKYCQLIFLLSGLCVLTSCGGGAGTGVGGSSDPGSSSSSFVRTGNMHTPRSMHTATLLTNGQVLIAGGTSNGGNSLASAELFNPAATFASTANMNI